MSRRGLRFSDLESLVGALRDSDGNRMQLSMVDAAAFLQYFGDYFFTRHDGRIDFTHGCFRQGVLDRLDDATPLHSLIASWLTHLPQDDEVRTQELCWHLIQSDDVKSLGYLLAAEGRNEGLRSAAKKDLSGIAVADDGDWLQASLWESVGEPWFALYGGFVTYDVFYEIPDTKEGLVICRKLTRTLLAIDEKYLEFKGDFAIKWDITICLERLSSVEQLLAADESSTKAVTYAKKCLEMRRELLKEIEGLDTREEQERFLASINAYAGIQITQTLLDEQVAALITMLRREVLRGICVADTQVADSLSHDYPATAPEALAHLRESLSIRVMFHEDGLPEGSNIASASWDEAYELAKTHHKLAEAYESIEDETSQRQREPHLLKAISLCEEMYRNAPSGTHAIVLSESYRLMASFLADADPQKLEDAIALARKGQDLMEPLYLRTRGYEEQCELSFVFNLLGELYSTKQDNESMAVAQEYFKRLSDITKGLVLKSDSVSMKKLAVMAGVKNALSLDNMSLDDVRKHFEQIYQQADEVFASFRDIETYSRLSDVYTALIDVIEGSPFGGEVTGKRAVVELRFANLEQGLRMDDVPLEMLKERVVRYSELGELIQELALPDDARWPEEWIELLGAVDIRKEALSIAPTQRAYDITKRSYEIAKQVYEVEESRVDLDAVAVSLSKLVTICMQVDFQEFAVLNHELLALAHRLLQETGDAKYEMMIFHAQLGEHIVSGTAGGFLDDVLSPAMWRGKDADAPRQPEEKPVDEKEIRDSFRSVRVKTNDPSSERKALEDEIQKLEAKAESISGIVAAFRRNKLMKRIQALREKLARLE